LNIAQARLPPKTRLITSYSLLLPNVTAEPPSEIVESDSSSSSEKKQRFKAIVEEVKIVPAASTDAPSRHPKLKVSKDPSTNPAFKFGVDPKLQDTGSVSQPPFLQEPIKGSHNTINKNKETVLRKSDINNKKNKDIK
jgi:hypothetical protein